MLGSKSIVHGEDGVPGRDGQLAADVIVGVEVTDHEPSTMEVHAQPGALKRWAIEPSWNTSGVDVTNFWKINRGDGAHRRVPSSGLVDALLGQRWISER